MCDIINHKAITKHNLKIVKAYKPEKNISKNSF